MNNHQTVAKNESENKWISVSVQNNIVCLASVCNGRATAFRTNLAERTGITKFSESSACRMRRFLRTSRANYTNFITLTYPHNFPKDGKIFKEHLRRFIQELSRANKRAPCHATGYKTEIDPSRWSAFWFMEYQERGAVHFHIFTNEFFDKKWTARTWYDICQTEDERHLFAGTRVERLRSGRDGAVSYAMKYAAKAGQKEIPDFVENPGRFWGVSGDKVTVSAATRVRLGPGGVKKVEIAYKKVTKWLKTRAEQGRITIIEVKNRPIKLFNVPNMADRAEIKALVSRLELINLMNDGVQPTYWMPEHHASQEQDIFYSSYGGKFGMGRTEHSDWIQKDAV